MIRYSANLGFLFTDRPLVARIEAAARAGFDAVEFHDQIQQADPGPIRAALARTGLGVTAINTHMGPGAGRAALPGSAFRTDFTEALAAAQAVGAGAIHVTAGQARGGDARRACIDNLAWALDRTDRPLLLEPICEAGIPGYHLATLEDFAEVAGALPDPRLRLMADWYHLATIHGETGALERIRDLLPVIGHVQLARVRDRGAPWPGDIEGWSGLRDLVAKGPGTLGLEYRPGDADPAAVLAALRAA